MIWFNMYFPYSSDLYFLIRCYTAFATHLELLGNRDNKGTHIGAPNQYSNLGRALPLHVDMNIILDRKQAGEGWFKLHKYE